jgi:hypothetical protein
MTSELLNQLKTIENKYFALKNFREKVESIYNDFKRNLKESSPLTDLTQSPTDSARPLFNPKRSDDRIWS